MRCRKVRSLLSAACSDELGDRQQAAIREHLASCSACRKESSYFTSINKAVSEMPTETLSDDFNTRLLNQIAQERFRETRTKAYLPRKAPLFFWRTLAPVMVSAALIVVVAVSLFQFGQPQSPSSLMATESGNVNNNYLTVQPTNNPNVPVTLRDDWTLETQLARAERLERISRQLSEEYGYGNMHLTSGSLTGSHSQPAVSGRVFPVPGIGYRVYQVNVRSSGRGDGQVY